ncbi:hypothetical protein [Streptomyces sp. MOE7]|uniref:hypothetical protein n=1 Tax=Streptomyces sp. MOE7 TaxID=1961713 RepID=UPI000A045C44|nr:hypothetical protein [Streptomyces sp. MOE7]ARH90105.1 hypothetical protein STRMOE7_07105 [Streptomyces sp. MOE7]
MAVSWRRIAVPAAALGVLVPAALGTHALLSDSGDAGPATAGARPSGSAGPEAVPDDAAAPGSEGAAVVAKPSNAPAGAGRSTAVRLSSYDSRGRRAVLEPAAGRTVRTGDVIAAAPNRHAPSGALFKVGKVTGSHGREVRVTTVPATLPEVLGDRKVDRRAVLRDGELSVRPLSAGVTVRTPSAAPGRDGEASPAPSDGASGPSDGATAPAGPGDAPGEGSPSPSASASGAPGARLGMTGTRATHTSARGALPAGAAKGVGALRLGVDVPLPKGVEATGKSRARLSGEVSFRPELIFRYDRRGGLNLLPERAAVGLGGSYSYGWQVHGKVRGVADTGEVAVPLAAVTGRHVFWVGPVPVVVSTEVTFTYRFTAGGRIVLDADQRTSGSFAVGAQYDRAHGWQPLHTAQQQTKGATPRVEGAASATARIGARAEVFLYDTAGVGGDLSVHLTGRAAAATGGGAPAWDLSAGYDLRTQLMLQLKIFGIQVVDLRTTPFALHDERKLFGRGKLPRA